MRSSITPEENANLQEKDCVSIDDLSVPATQVLEEQTGRADSEDRGMPLFVP